MFVVNETLQVIRTAEYVRGYFDGEGCVKFSTKPTKWGRGAGLVVETTDLDLMRDLLEPLASWGIRASYGEHPPRVGANRPTARVSVGGRTAIEAVLAKIRPLSVKHEERLRNVYAFWSAQDELVRRLALGEELVKKGHTYAEAAKTAGVTFKQLANSIAYSKRTGRTRIRPPNLLKQTAQARRTEPRVPRRRLSDMRALVVLALLLAACATAVPTSGMRGTILAGPACPSPARLDRRCPDRPVSMTVEVVQGTTIYGT